MESMYCDREKEHQAAAQRAKERILSASDAEKISAVFRVLADPTRMKLVLALMNGNMCVYHLSEVAGNSVSAVSHQLRVLRECNVVKAERLGKNVEYSIADGHVREIIDVSIRHLSCMNKE